MGKIELFTITGVKARILKALVGTPFVLVAALLLSSALGGGGLLEEPGLLLMVGFFA